MPVINRIADFAEEMKTWRRHLHMNPELDLECHQTAAFVVEQLRAFGVDEIHEKIGVSGVVGLIRGKGEGFVVGLRADMDALPMEEKTGLDHASTVPGRMHACGHDGHTTMLMGAAKYLAETRNFNGTVALIFQPAEEGSGGARYMIEDGLMRDYGISQVYALHSLPGIPVGAFQTTSGPIMAAADDWQIDIQGRGGHAAHPDQCVDPIIIATGIAQAFQSIVARNLDPIKTGVLSVTQLHAGSAHNVIAGTATLGGTVRTFEPEVKAMIRARMETVIEQVSAAYGGTATLTYNDGYPPTYNHVAETAFAGDIAEAISSIDRDGQPSMGAEDFSYMLEKVPGSFLYVGNGDTPELHHPEYDFDDEAAPFGASFFVKVAETALA
ncbi:MAG: M20 aminoacylase family protein [Pseudomonadota bacterium]